MKEGYEKYCRFYGCEEKECWYNGCQCEGERLIIKEPKQETLEEVAEKNFINIGGVLVLEDGAKWQQERSYSEEDLKEGYEFAIENVQFGRNGYEWVTFEEWFEQFKKK